MAALIAQLVFDGLVMGLIFVLLAVGMTLIMSTARVLFLAYGMFYTLGAFTVWWATSEMHMPYYISLLIGIVAALIFGLLSYSLIFHRLLKHERGFMATLIASLGLAMFLSQAALLILGSLPRGLPPVFPAKLDFYDIRISMDKMVLILSSVAVTLLLFWVYEKTKIGRAIRAVTFNKEAATLQGINPTFIFMLVFGISTALAGFTGGILAPSFGISPDMGNNILWSVFLMMMLGGMDSLLGAVVAGVIIGQMLSFGQYFIGATVQIFIFIVIGIIIYFRPNGLLGKKLSSEL